jgi:acid phosphatase type 7
MAGNAGAGYYSMNLGSWHLIALNSNCAFVPVGCGAGSPEEQWLEQDLANDHAACTLAYWHHPLFHSGGELGGDAMKQIYTDLYNAHATLVLNGHEHQYERFAPQDPNGNLDTARGVVEFVVGTGGRDLEDFRPDSAQQPGSQRHELWRDASHSAPHGL